VPPSKSAFLGLLIHLLAPPLVVIGNTETFTLDNLNNKKLPGSLTVLGVRDGLAKN